MRSSGRIQEIIAREDQVAALLGTRPIRPRPSEQLSQALEAWSAAVWAAARDGGTLTVDAKAGLELARRGVFICGVHRSGTTLVRDLLDGHPRLCVLPSEGSFLTELRRKLTPPAGRDWIETLGAEWIRRLANPTNQPPYWLLGRTTSDAAPYTMFARLLMGWWPVVKQRFEAETPLWPHLAVVLAYASIRWDDLEAAGLKWWVDKTPTNELYLETHLDGLPSARVVHVVRHPLAVYASRKQLDLRTFGTFRSRRRAIVEMRRSFRTAARRMTTAASGESLRTVRDRGTIVAGQLELREFEARDPEARAPETRRFEARNSEAREPEETDPEVHPVQHYCVVRYEDVVAHPTPTMQRLADFLEIDMDPVLLRPTVSGRPAAANSSFDRMPEAGIIRLDGTDRSSTLTRPERALIRLSVGRYARLLGYSFD